MVLERYAVIGCEIEGAGAVVYQRADLLGDGRFARQVRLREPRLRPYDGKGDGKSEHAPHGRAHHKMRTRLVDPSEDQLRQWRHPKGDDRDQLQLVVVV